VRTVQALDLLELLNPVQQLEIPVVLLLAHLPGWSFRPLLAALACSTYAPELRRVWRRIRRQRG
jgi:hypothetical protein